MTEVRRMTLADFLLARIDEDAEVATRAFDQPLGYRWRSLSWLTEANRDHGLRHDPEHVLAECEAKRRVVKQVSNVRWGGYAVRDVVLELLALPYADHPDYRAEWGMTG